MDSIKELIIKNVETTLAGITVANGFLNTLAAVHRFRQSGFPRKDIPFAGLTQGPDMLEETASGSDGPLTERLLTVFVDAVTRHDETADARPSDEVLNALEQDVTKAMLTDPFRGGHAIDTIPGDIDPVEIEAGQPEIASRLQFHIHYRHRRDDATAAT